MLCKALHDVRPLTMGVSPSRSRDIMSDVSCLPIWETTADMLSKQLQDLLLKFQKIRSAFHSESFAERLGCPSEQRIRRCSSF